MQIIAIITVIVVAIIINNNKGYNNISNIFIIAGNKKIQLEYDSVLWTSTDLFKKGGYTHGNLVSTLFFEKGKYAKRIDS